MGLLDEVARVTGPPDRGTRATLSHGRILRDLGAGPAHGWGGGRGAAARPDCGTAPRAADDRERLAPRSLLLRPDREDVGAPREPRRVRRGGPRRSSRAAGPVDAVARP